MTDDRRELDEKIVLSWVQLSSVIKNGRITDGLAYNEAVTMLLLYNEYRRTGSGVLPFSHIVRETKMLKSLAVRTITSLESKGFVTRLCSQTDRRTVDVAIVPEKLEEFLKVHSRSLKIADDICNLIGEEDAHVFVRIVAKIVGQTQTLPETGGKKEDE